MFLVIFWQWLKALSCPIFPNIITMFRFGSDNSGLCPLCPRGSAIPKNMRITINTQMRWNHIKQKAAPGEIP
jgi:hypothetical protein